MTETRHTNSFNNLHPGRQRRRRRRRGSCGGARSSPRPVTDSTVRSLSLSFVLCFVSLFSTASHIGVAIIAHLFSVPSASSCSSVSTSPDPRRHHHATPPSSFSPFEDPFASTAKASSSGADMCLGLEMLRGRDLLELVDDHDCGGGGFSVQHVQPTTVHCRDVSVLPGPVEQEEAQGENAWRSTTTTSVDRKGKGKQRESPTLTTTTTRRTVKVETPTDVRVYIDERCTDTVEWFEDRFCRRGGTDRGIELDAGGSVSSLSLSPHVFVKQKKC